MNKRCKIYIFAIFFFSNTIFQFSFYFTSTYLLYHTTLAENQCENKSFPVFPYFTGTYRVTQTITNSFVRSYKLKQNVPYLKAKSNTC